MTMLGPKARKLRGILIRQGKLEDSSLRSLML